MGTAAIRPILDALSELESVQIRRALMDRVVKLGPEVGVAAMERLADERWFVKRNMLKIIGDLELPPPGFNPSDYFQHDDARVRREALRLMLRDPALRERAILRALGDEDERTVRTALAAALQACPPTALPLVASRALSGATLDLRLTAIRVLGACGHRSAVDTLLTLTAPRRSFFWFKRPPSKRPEYVTALSALRAFGDDPRARAILDSAAMSKDAEIAQAAAGKQRASAMIAAPPPEP
jgi:HEAT repeat protein